MNQKIKFRESFRPFAPAVLREHVHEYFEMRAGQDSPYMLLVAGVRADKRIDAAAGEGARGFDKLKQPRSVIPAVTHVDHSARVQTIDVERNPRFHAIVSAFARKTGCPLVINTSFNVRGEPIVNTPADAYRCFMATDIDALVIERFVMLKPEQAGAALADRNAYLSQFEPD
jgi:carbamoyltransferase